MTAELTLFAALAIGLAGSPHCLGMCGGIASSLGATTAGRGGGRWQYALCYNLGRLGSYTLMGALVALLLSLPGITLARPEWGMVLRLATGLVLLAVAAYLLFDWSGLRRIEVVGGRLWRLIGPYARRLLPVQSASGALALGALWGWLPCGLVYTVLLAAAVSGDPVSGAGIMLAFGLGTLPAMTGVTLFGQALRGWQTSRTARRVLGVLLLAFGLWTMASPLAHLTGGHADHAHHHAAAP
ncbi:MAG: sulfite exporter TauE/SafE family protein [Ectothiorhodospiraceae bacterium]|nr:sulfite exporter TauE/SafE family protein [Ectothiorhodospiraceae bacterium]MCH8503158.1 sulfite exporter TauE/SafE family protein [Ectothiorhodospiraceae bacterium]